MLPNEISSNQHVIVLINTLSSTLLNIDAEYESDVARIQSTAAPDLKPVILDTVRQRHKERREPYIRHLAELRRHLNAHCYPSS